MMNEILIPKIDERPSVIGAGLVALDVIISSNPKTSPQFLSGGSCGNVLTILSYFGWNAFPIARLSNNSATLLLKEDFANWDVKSDLLSVLPDGSTPIIIHRILKDKEGAPKHRFEFRNPENGSYLPSYKPVLASKVSDLVAKKPNCQVFFFDRINRASIELARKYKENGSLIFFEPSSNKDHKGFLECLEIADIVKFSNDRISDYDEKYFSVTSKLVIQTLGAEGLKFKRSLDDQWTKLESFAIENVVDAAGAGDWLTAGIITKLFKDTNRIIELSNESIINAIKFGQVLSCLNCLFEGARGAMYSMSAGDLLTYVEYLQKQDNPHIGFDKKTPATSVRAVDQPTISSLYS